MGMPIPDLDGTGLLPTGIHLCTLDEIEAKFASVAHTDQRRSLWGKFRRFVARVRPMDHWTAVFVDGSFVTDEAAPSDIDAILLVKPSGSPSAAPGQLERDLYALESEGVKSLYSVDLKYTFSGNDGVVAFFQQLRAEEAKRRGLLPGTTKGMLRVAL